MVVRTNACPFHECQDGWPASSYVSLLAEHSCHPLANGPLVAGMQWERLIVRRRPRSGDDKRARPRASYGDDDLAAACVADKVLVCEAAKELAGGRFKTVRFHTAESFKIRGLAGRVTAYPAEKAARVVDAAAAP